MKHIDVFPTRVWYKKFDELLKHHSDWIEDLFVARVERPESRSYSVKNGWQGELSLQTDNKFSALKDVLLPVFNETLKQMAPDKNIQYKVNAWANIQDHGGYNEAHVHPFSLFSAVYYLKVTNKSGRINFKDPRLGLQNHIFASSSNPPPPNNFSSIKIQPEEGLLLIFPSWLEHFTELNYDSSERISIAMNIDLLN
jgi:uncharacterized protein (TIGR02466 family)